MWGLTTPHFRIIPAYAGQIEGICIRYPARWDHPRIRGTNKTHSRAFFVLAGSSPHTRDKSSVNKINDDTIGIIPAYAGQMGKSPQLSRLDWDHPRIRGTNSNFVSHSGSGGGSPPHTRDKYCVKHSDFKNGRITPAYAGQIKGTSSTTPV